MNYQEDNPESPKNPEDEEDALDEMLANRIEILAESLLEDVDSVVIMYTRSRADKQTMSSCVYKGSKMAALGLTEYYRNVLTNS